MNDSVRKLENLCALQKESKGCNNLAHYGYHIAEEVRRSTSSKQQHNLKKIIQVTKDLSSTAVESSPFLIQAVQKLVLMMIMLLNIW